MTSTTTFAPHVAVYVRISRDPYDTLAGVTRQREDCTKIAADRWPDLPVVVYEDNDVSAWSGKRRPAYEAMIEGIRSGSASAVVAWDQDRLTRQPRELESLIDLCESVKLTQLVTASGDLDLTTHDGRFKARIMAAVAAKSSDDTSRRIRRQKQDAREKNHYPGGPLPYGITAWVKADFRIDPACQAVVERARDRVIEGWPLNQVRKAAQAEDPSCPSTVFGWRSLLMKSRLLSPEDRALMREILTDPKRRQQKGTDRVWWLSGVLRCGICGTSMVHTNANRTGREHWRCRTPNDPVTGTRGFHTGIDHLRTERAVELALFAHAYAVERAPAPVATPGPDDEKLAEVAAMYAAGEITRAEWQSMRDVLTAAATPTVTPLHTRPIDLEAAWPNMDVQAKHRTALRIVEAVDVGLSVVDGKRVQTDERLTFRWRV